MKAEHRLHKPARGDTFTLGFGPDAMTCDVVSVKGDLVRYTVRKDGEAREFHLGSPTHMMAGWRGED